MPKFSPTVPVQVQVCPAPLTNRAVAVCPGVKQVISAKADDAARRQERRPKRNMLMQICEAELEMKDWKLLRLKEWEDRWDVWVIDLIFESWSTEKWEALYTRFLCSSARKDSTSHNANFVVLSQPRECASQDRHSFHCETAEWPILALSRRWILERHTCGCMYVGRALPPQEQT